MVEVIPLTGIGEVRAGADLAALLAPVLGTSDLGPGDVLVVTQKIVSKAEGRYVDLSKVEPSARAYELAAITGKEPQLVELVLRESAAVVRAAPHVLITRHRSGHVMANAGIDRSNLDPAFADCALLLPEDADRSAADLRARLAKLLPHAPAVVISDSFGRPWRNGVVNVAIGVAGLQALVDHRGDKDRNGRTLEVTQVALGDMVATAAGLVMGEAAEGIPAAIVRGVKWTGPESGAQALIRPREQDLFA